MSKSRIVAIVVADAAVLVLLRPDLGALRRGIAEPRRWVAESGADLVVTRLAGAALWLVSAWVAIALLAALAATLPGTTGRCAAAVAAVALPAVLRRVVIGSAGLGVLLAPVAAQAHSVAARPPSASTVASVAPVDPVPGPSWPTSPVPPVHSAPLPGPAWPRVASPTPAPAPTPVPHTAPPVGGPAPKAPAERVTVRAGDCLWLLAAHRLGPTASDAELAAYVPRWHAANRSVIGADPDLLLPGQVLDVPPAA